MERGGTTPSFFRRQTPVDPMKKLTLPRRRMIKKKSEFQLVYTKGKGAAGRYIILRALKRGPENPGVKKSVRESAVLEYSKLPAKLAVAAGKKLGCAVVRNRVKRLLREAFRLEQETVADGWSLMLIGRPGAVAAHGAEIRRELRYLLKKTELLK